MEENDRIRGRLSRNDLERTAERELARFLAAKPPPSKSPNRHLHQSRGSILAGAPRGAAVAAIAYLDRAGDEEWGGDRHDVLVRGGDSRWELEDAFEHLEYIARRKSGPRADRVAETYVAALPRGATIDQVQAIGERIAALYQEHDHLVGWAVHRPPDPKKGNLHLHVVATARPMQRNRGAGTAFDVTAKYRVWTKDAPPPLQTYKQFRKAVAEIMNTVVPGAQIDGGRMPDRPGLKRLPRWAYDALTQQPDLLFEDVLQAAAPDPTRLRQARYVAYWNRAVIEERDPVQDPEVIRIRSDLAREGLNRPKRDPKPRRVQTRSSTAERQGSVPLPQLTDRQIGLVVDLHRRAQIELAPDWAATAEGRAAAFGFVRGWQANLPPLKAIVRNVTQVPVRPLDNPPAMPAPTEPKQPQATPGPKKRPDQER